MAQSLIVIQGGSATGKTTLATKLQKDLQFPLLTKDAFKEMMYDTIGFPNDRVESAVYGKAAMAALYASARVFLENERSVIIEAAFVSQFANKDLLQLTSGLSVRTFQLFCVASPDVRYQRELKRSRHEGHYGLTLEDFTNDSEKHGKLNTDVTISINSEKFGDKEYQQLIYELRTDLLQGA